MKRFLLWILGGLAVAAIVVLKVLGARRTAESIPVPGRRPEVPARPSVTPQQHWRSVSSYFEWMIQKWEIGHNRQGVLVTYQKHPNDSGNYNSRGELVGTNYGVSAVAYEGVLGRPPTEADIRAITLQEAARIGADNYYRAPGFDRLPWCPATEIVVDYGWGSGPVYAAKQLQRVLGVDPDGVVGPITQREFARWIGDSRETMAEACREISKVRRDHWWRISEPGSRNAPFRTGWMRRADWYLPENPEWWKWGQ